MGGEVRGKEGEEGGGREVGGSKGRKKGGRRVRGTCTPSPLHSYTPSPPHRSDS